MCGQPVSAVLKTTSPTSVPVAPKLKPCQHDPSSSTRRQVRLRKGLASADAVTDTARRIDAPARRAPPTTRGARADDLRDGSATGEAAAATVGAIDAAAVTDAHRDGAAQRGAAAAAHCALACMATREEDSMAEAARGGTEDEGDLLSLSRARARHRKWAFLGEGEDAPTRSRAHGLVVPPRNATAGAECKPMQHTATRAVLRFDAAERRACRAVGDGRENCPRESGSDGCGACRAAVGGMGGWWVEGWGNP
eukprot:307924-Chlamydomonas_euryale.AAC.4